MCKTVEREREREGVMNDRNSLVNPAAKSAAVASVVTAAAAAAAACMNG